MRVHHKQVDGIGTDVKHPEAHEAKRYRGKLGASAQDSNL